jgi:hypothetical protein
VVADNVPAPSGSGDSSGPLQVLLVAEPHGIAVSGDPVMFSGLSDLGGDDIGDSPASRFCFKFCYYGSWLIYSFLGWIWVL